MSRKNQSITISLSPEEKLMLESIAFELGYIWGNRGNISALMKALANGDIAVGKFVNSEFSNKPLILEKLKEIEDLL